jgi:hypothetical protein
MAQGLGINTLGEATEMRQQRLATRKLFGLVELDKSILVHIRRAQ